MLLFFELFFSLAIFLSFVHVVPLRRSRISDLITYEKRDPYFVCEAWNENYGVRQKARERKRSKAFADKNTCNFPIDWAVTQSKQDSSVAPSYGSLNWVKQISVSRPVNRTKSTFFIPFFVFPPSRSLFILLITRWLSKFFFQAHFSMQFCSQTRARLWYDVCKWLVKCHRFQARQLINLERVAIKILCSIETNSSLKIRTAFQLARLCESEWKSFENYRFCHFFESVNQLSAQSNQ